MSTAVVFTEYGGPEVLRLVDVEVPEPGPGEVRVRIKAAGVQPVDALLRSGAVAMFMPATFPQKLGNEFAGVVEAVGDGAGWSVGDEVIGFQTTSCYADEVIVGADQIVAKPAGMPWAEAGSLSASGQTASTVLEDLGVDKGDVVLIHAAAGGVGTFAVQIAVAAGATVIGTASERNHEFLRSLGAIPVTYGDGLVERVRAAAPDGRVDAALDAAGTAEASAASLELVADPARVGTTVPRAAMAEPRVRRLTTRRDVQRLAGLVRLYEAGSLRVFVERTFPLAEAAEAHRAIEGGHVRGKVVLVME